MSLLVLENVFKGCNNPNLHVTGHSAPALVKKPRCRRREPRGS